MKIGIFGDSFGDGGKMPITEKSRPWYNYLSDYHEVHNYSASGVSLYYSYNRYLENKEVEFDRVIFLVTSVGRLSILTGKQELTFPNQVTHFDHAKGLLVHAVKKNHSHRIMLYQTAMNYFLHYQDQKQERLYHQLMLEKIRQIPNCLILPNFTDSFPMESGYVCLHNISEIDDHHYRNELTQDYNFMFFDVRHCHFHDENNNIFGQKILKWIDTGEWNLNMSEFTTPSDPLSYYMSNNFGAAKG